MTDVGPLDKRTSAGVSHRRSAISAISATVGPTLSEFTQSDGSQSQRVITICYTIPAAVMNLAGFVKGRADMKAILLSLVAGVALSASS